MMPLSDRGFLHHVFPDPSSVQSLGRTSHIRGPAMSYVPHIGADEALEPIPLAPIHPSSTTTTRATVAPPGLVARTEAIPVSSTSSPAARPAAAPARKTGGNFHPMP